VTARPVELHPAADFELSEARGWYAERDEVAAERFVQALDRAIELVAEAPERWPVWPHGARPRVPRPIAAS
jgi:plasmid stabilization system protein ParE